MTVAAGMFPWIPIGAPRIALRAYYLYRRFTAGRRHPAFAQMLAHRDAFYLGAWSDAAKHANAEIEDLGNNYLRLTRGRRSAVVNRNFNPLDDQCAVLLSGNKAATYRLLAREGLPVPRHAVYATQNDVPMHPLPGCVALVVKPAAETGGGDGVSTGVSTLRGLRDAAEWAGAYARGVLIEEHVPGDTIRLLYLDGRLLDCVRRRSPWLVGDGRRSVADLVRAENQERLRARFQRSQSLLRVDREMRATLAAQRLGLHRVPAAGLRFTAKRVVNENRGADNQDLNGQVCDAIVEAGRRAAAALGLRLAGIDVICTDVARPLELTGGRIIDVNAEPGFYYHYHKDGECNPVACDILARVLSDG